MATVTIFHWIGKRRRCSECGAEGIPRSCGCTPARVESWCEWLTFTDITLGAWYPKARFERVVASERAFEPWDPV